MNKILIIFFIALNSMSFYAQELPDYIVYNKGFQKDSFRIKNLLKDVLQSKKSRTLIFDKILYIGPYLWAELRSMKSSKIEKGNITFKIPNQKEDILKDGKLIQTKEDFKILLEDLRILLGDNYKIGNLNKNDFAYYWSIIFFDISDPIFLLTGNSHRIIFDFDENSKLLFLEISPDDTSMSK